MNRPMLTVMQLEDRATPVSLSIAISVGLNSIIGPIDPVSPPVPPLPPPGDTGGGVVVSPPPPTSPPVTGV